MPYGGTPDEIKAKQNAASARWYRRHRSEVLARQKEGYTPKIIKGHCPICGAWNESLHRDHDHNSGEQREPICRNCNIMLGMARDNPTTLEMAAQYLRKHASRIVSLAEKKVPK